MRLDSLDVALGLVVVFLLVSTVCSAAREALEAILKTRAAYLESAIRQLLDDESGKGLAKTLFEHPLLSALFLGDYRPKPTVKKLWLLANGRGLPSYVPAASFARVLLDIAARGTQTDDVSSDPSSPPMTVASVRARLLNIESARVRRVLLHALDTSRGDLELAKKNLEDWFNDSMDRVSGWYKRSTQWVVLVIALVVTAGMNVDSVAIAKHLYRSEEARAAAVASAERIHEQGQPKEVEDARRALAALDLPIGWSKATLPHGSVEWLNRGLGWLLTAFAATLGAPFWFDVLNKVMVIRSTVKPREKSPDEFSEDRQAAPAPVLPGASPAPLASSPALPVASPASVPDALASAPSVVFAPREPADEHDACGAQHAGSEWTADEDLPVASGGVES